MSRHGNCSKKDVFGGGSGGKKIFLLRHDWTERNEEHKEGGKERLRKEIKKKRGKEEPIHLSSSHFRSKGAGTNKVR